MSPRARALVSLQPHGDITASYGTFGTANVGFNLAYGREKWGNFISVNGLNTGRFLDGPEFQVYHDHGNEENIFDRFDFKPSQADTINLNFGFTRSWFQTPNSFDAQTADAWSGLVVNNGGLGPNGLPVGSQDQRSKIRTFNIAPTWTHLLNPSTVFTLGAFARQDQYNYYPSDNPFADFTPDLQSETIGQSRTLTNLGVRANVSYVKGIHNIKAGITYEDTILTEKDSFGIVDPTFNPVCFNADGSPNTNPSLTNPNNCTGTLQPNPAYDPLLACIDLTRTGPLDRWLSQFHQRVIRLPRPRQHPGIGVLFPGHHDDKELDLQPRRPVRPLRRHHQRQSRRTSAGYRLQHQAQQYRAADFLCPHA